MEHDRLRQAAEQLGIARCYEDVWGGVHAVSDDTLAAVLRAYGLPDDAAGIQQALYERDVSEWQRVLPPVLVAVEAAPIRIRLRVPVAGGLLRWRCISEEGAEHEGVVDFVADGVAHRTRAESDYLAADWTLPLSLPPGYHRFEVRHANDAAVAMSLIVAPARCYAPPQPLRAWGFAVSVYALRSSRDWGMGDYTALRQLVNVAADAGADLIGVNPLHALFPHEPRHASPYSPASRLWLNVLYIDPEAVPEFAACTAAQTLVGSPDFQATVTAQRAATHVDYATVARLRFEVLEALYADFRAAHLDAGTDRARDFREWAGRGGQALHLTSVYFALMERYGVAGSWGWQHWPADYHDPQGPAVRAFADAEAERVTYYSYLQWLAAAQLADVESACRASGLAVGLYRDLAVGSDPGGADGWLHRHLHAPGMTVGCPPDLFNPNGQNWGLPAPLPDAMRAEGYATFIELVRANMRHAGALRIDHVMGLMRLFWVPDHELPLAGTYVHNPLDDLLGIVALESMRARCLVVGEDLGTLPDGLREALAARGILSYRLLFFERTADGAYAPPAAYPEQALAAVTTHDLPTLYGYWEGRDITLRTELQLYPTEETRDQQIVDRAQDRARLLLALNREGLLPAGVPLDPAATPHMHAQLAAAVHAYLARSAAMLFTVQPEDVFGEREQLNVPATIDEYPNWRRRLQLPLEQWGQDNDYRMLTEGLSAERPAFRRSNTTGRSAFIPRCTYRLQLHKDFDFARATQIIPYLAQLGIDCCYTSPYFHARPGSRHGYDIVGHDRVNPEIGDAAAHAAFVAALQRHGMSHMVDMVPNHMGVMGADNAWWLDVLENGPASAYAGFFDIDWDTALPDLRGRVLLPVLGDHYGEILDRGELRLEFDAAGGSFTVAYHQHRFPIDPREYPHILAPVIEQMTGTTAGSDYAALVTAFRHLPSRQVTAATQREERQRDKEVHKRRLAQLCEADPGLAAAIAARVVAYNGGADTAGAVTLLDELLERQAWRLAYWRVAADEINYRRFFDVNELAALRMEDGAVFDATHRLLLEWLRSGQLQAVRIDHPDGLAEPGAYFERLQQASGRGAARAGGAPPLYLVIEKILADHERLPESWPIYGTTGYRFANLVNGLFVERGAEREMDRIYRTFARETTDYETLLFEAKRYIMRTSLAAELNVLANRLARLARSSRHTRDYTVNSLRNALSVFVACFPVYRTYITDAVHDEDRRHIEWAAGLARRRGEDIDQPAIEFVRRVLLGLAFPTDDAQRQPLMLAFARRFQQFTAALTAKGMEDTAFYRYNRLVSLNEVGGNPRNFGISVAAFHQATLDRARHYPHTLIATSTHDTKRSEDVRARIDVITEFVDEWWTHLQRWRRVNRRFRKMREGEPLPSRNDEYLLYQTLIGSWPGLAGLAPSYEARIQDYMRKAVREAKLHTSWSAPDEAYETALEHFVHALLEPRPGNPFLADFAPLAEQMAHYGRLNALAQVVLKITAPGVPDIYQGNELWDLSLVDPDNRRPVDYQRRAQLLDEMTRTLVQGKEACAAYVRMLREDLADDRAKLYVTWVLLELRRRAAAVFRSGGYTPFAVAGSHAERVCAYARVHEREAVIVCVPCRVRAVAPEGGLPLGGLWGDTCLRPATAVPAGMYQEVFGGGVIRYAPDEPLAVSTLLSAFPVAVWVHTG